MKKVLIVLSLIAGFGIAKAQDDVTFTGEELTTYAQVMVWAEVEKGRMTEIYNGWINNDKTLEATRFVEIKNAKGDTAKLQEIEALGDELMAFEKIQVDYDSMIASFTEVYKEKIKGDIGAGLYNSLRKELKKNANLKSRYQAIYDALLEERRLSSEGGESEG